MLCGFAHTMECSPAIRGNELASAPSVSTDCFNIVNTEKTKLRKYTEHITSFLYIYKHAKQYSLLFKNTLTANRSLKPYTRQQSQIFLPLGSEEERWG